MDRAGVVPWPDDVARGYVAAGYWRQQPLGACMWDWADRYGSRVAVIDGDRRLGYQELAEIADALAEQLAGQGLACGDSVVVQLPNSWEFLAVLLACQRLGVTPVLALMPHRERELTHLVQLAGAAALVVPDQWDGYDHQRLATRVAHRQGRTCRVLVVGNDVDRRHVDVRRLPQPAGSPVLRRQRLDAAAPDPGQVALFLLSGGTTGPPKIIGRTHNDYEYNARRSGEVCRFDVDTVYLAALPVAHNFALGSPGVLGTLMAGGRVVLLTSPEPHAVFAAVARERVTVTSAVPGVVRRWLQVAASSPALPDLSSLKVLQVGGSPLPAELARQIAPVLGARLQQVFGMAEGLLNYTRPDDPDDVVLDTQGRPICPDDEIRIVGKDGRPVPPGEPGELWTRGPYTPRGYFAAPEHNAQAFIDGWYRTGDIVRLHSSGNLVVQGRAKDVINRGGEKISAEEVETITRTLSQVVDVAAVPAPHDELGECVCVCVVLAPGQRLTLPEVRAVFAREGVARFKAPEHLQILSRLPLTAVGKVNKKALREQVSAALGSLPAGADSRAADRAPARPGPEEAPAELLGHVR